MMGGLLVKVACFQNVPWCSESGAFGRPCMFLRRLGTLSLRLFDKRPSAYHCNFRRYAFAALVLQIMPNELLESPQHVM